MGQSLFLELKIARIRWRQTCSLYRLRCYYNVPTTTRTAPKEVTWCPELIMVHQPHPRSELSNGQRRAKWNVCRVGATAVCCSPPLPPESIWKKRCIRSSWIHCHKLNAVDVALCVNRRSTSVLHFINSFQLSSASTLCVCVVAFVWCGFVGNVFYANRGRVKKMLFFCFIKKIGTLFTLNPKCWHFPFAII